METRWAIAGAGALASMMVIFAACVGDADAPAVDETDGGTDGPVSSTRDGQAQGAACANGKVCASGFCADGVCCDTACEGTCEKCNLPSTSGTCTAIPSGQDPDKECLPIGDAGASVDAAASDAALNTPEGGIALDDTKCGGTCGGNRACAYPGAATSCGSSFCNTIETVGNVSCGGTGHCGVAVAGCKGFTCPDGTQDGGGTIASSCLTSCTSAADCADNFYCAGAMGCLPDLKNGVMCSSPVQCASGNCVGTVCCNDACNITGGTCTSAGKIGQCTCSACATGPCTTWYTDADGDGYGDINATILNGKAVYGCLDGVDGGAPPPPAAGYVLDNTDCFDSPGVGANVHPGQLNFFTTPYGPSNSFDYNCDNVVSKSLQETPGSTGCGFCTEVGPPYTCKTPNPATCAAANTQAYNACSFTVNSMGKLTCHGGTTAISAFRNTVACGGMDTYYTCETCTTVNGTASVSMQIGTQECN